MKFGAIRHNSVRKIVLCDSNGNTKFLGDVCAAAGRPVINSMLALIECAGKDASLLKTLEAAVRDVASFDINQVEWLPPVARPSKILGVAFNNKKLMEKAHVDPGVPNFFLKPPSAMQAHKKPIKIDPAWGAVIPEPEICAIIGRTCKNIDEASALRHVFGFAIHNDVTSHGLKFMKDSIAVTYEGELARPEFFRWRNRRDDKDTDAYFVYHTRSKGVDTFGPIGPWITHRSDVPNPNNLAVVADIDGEVFATDNTSNYRFSLEACIAEASRYFTLEPGDIISFGTTGKGAGRFINGHKSVLMGEMTGTIGIDVELLGRLENPIEHINAV